MLTVMLEFEFTSVSEWKNWRRQMHSKYLVSNKNIEFLQKKPDLSLENIIDDK